MIPLYDDVPRSRWPVVTLALIAANCFVFFQELTASPDAREQLITTFSLIPARSTAYLEGAPVGFNGGILPFLTSMFLHGGWLHLIGNMWFLWIFGDNVEDRTGHWRYLLLYLVGGLAGAVAHWFFNQQSMVPTVGASGAIAAVMGAYLITFPGARVRTLIPIIIFFTTVDLPAYLLLIYWLVLQTLSGVVSISAADPMQGGVAFLAHVGGFLAGIPLMILLRQRRKSPRAAW